jgi:hypothetical protein
MGSFYKSRQKDGDFISDALWIEKPNGHITNKVRSQESDLPYPGWSRIKPEHSEPTNPL